MAARPVDANDRGVRNLTSTSRWRARARRHPLRYRLAVIGADPGDVVRHAGGWLFDRVGAGWEAAVLVDGDAATRPLDMLGATVLDRREALAAPLHELRPHTLAVDTATYLADERVRAGVLGCLDRGLSEVVLWGADLPTELDEVVAPVWHRMSAAGRAFKFAALAAAGTSVTPADATEVFRIGEPRAADYAGEVRSAR
ncbi:hypothetical protein ACWDSJ_10770 [Nocardia sp. NPDC003482]